MADVLIQNALIVDGSGGAPFDGHVRVSGDLIAAVAASGTADGNDIVARGAAQVIDAADLALAPGFIDAHSHFDWMLPLTDHEFLHPILEQGITTVVTGNCGFSPAPVGGSEGAERINAFAGFCLEEPLAFEWEDMAGLLDHLSRAELLCNNAQLLGHGSVHLAELGELLRPPTGGELERVVARTAAELGSGAFGLSLGLMYPPGMFYGQADLLPLSREAAARDLLLTVHTRALSKYSPSYPIIPLFGKPHNLKALEEMLAIGLETGVKLQISHLIFAGRKSWPTAERAVRMIEKARARGLAVMWDVYPHFCGNSYINVFLPAWFLKNLEQNLDDPRAVRKMKFELNLAARLLGFNLTDIQIMQALFPGGQAYEGMDLGEIADREGIGPMDALIALVRKSSGKALQLTYGYSGDDANEGLMAAMLSHECCLFETDTILKSSGFANPASYGAFPRILGRFVREKKALSLQEAVSRMSGVTAGWFGIPRRGRIAPGCYADLVLFDPQRVADNTTRKDTARRPSGIAKVFVNGTLAVEGGAYIGGVRAGRVLRKP